MKHITYKQYCDIEKALTDYVDSRTDAYGYLFKIINGREFGSSRHEWGGKVKPVLIMSRIKELWDNERLYRGVIRLAIFVHYKGNVIEFSRGDKRLIMEDFIRLYARHLVERLKKDEEKFAYGLAE